MKTTSTWMATGMLVSLLSLAAGCAGLPGLRAGNMRDMRDWTIVLPADAIDSETYAAEELRTFFEQATGIELPITDGTTKSARGRIFVGAGEAMRASAVGFDTAGFGPEDLRIVVGKRAIAIAGGRPRGTLYGVYTFLEDVLGVRFLTAEHTHVPRLPRDFVLAPIDRSFSPVLSWRYSNAQENADIAFAVRNRLNHRFGAVPERFGGRASLALIGHSYHSQLPWARYGKDHPEYFNEKNGKRPTSGRRVQPCFTNPDVRRIITEAVLRDLEQNPGLPNIAVAMNDNYRFCACAKCKAIDDAAGSNMGANLDMVNEIADVVAETHPDVLVGTLAYYWTRKPPKNTVPRPNVQIQLCSIQTCQIHPLDDPNCSRNSGYIADLEAWGEVAEHLYFWHYVANFSAYLNPLPLLRSVGSRVRLAVEHGAKGIFMQGPADSFGGGSRSSSAVANLSGLRNYVICNLLWDPTRDEQALIDQFVSLYYGEQAGAVREYIAIIHDAAYASGQHPPYLGSAEQFGITPQVALRGIDVLERAITATDDPVLRTRLERETIGCYGVLIDRVALPFVWHRAPATTDADKRAARPYIGKFLDLCRRHKVTMFSEVRTVAHVEANLRALYGLGTDDKF